MPLCAVVNKRLIPLGTAFLISKLGIVATAAHVIQEAMRYDESVHTAYLKGTKKKGLNLNGVQLSVIHHMPVGNGRTIFHIWPLENIQIATPTDVAYGFLKVQQSFPYAKMRISPAAPRIGDTVFCIGYCESNYPKGGVPIDKIKDGTFDWIKSYSHRFSVAEAKVKALFIHRFSRGYADGPCFLVDSELKHGQSGGPVFNSAGNICGINLGGASTLTNKPSGLASLIYPTLAIKIKLSIRVAKTLKFDALQPLINLCKNNSVLTDGSERLGEIVLHGDEFQTNPLIHKDDASNTFNDFHGYQTGVPAIPVGGIDG